MKKFLLLLAVLVASSLAFMNCGTAGKCSPTNCGGCCDSTGTCVTATSATACGKQGEACTTCMAPTNVCIAGACAAGTTGGGGGTTGGGGGTTGGGGGTTGGGTGGGGGASCTAFDFSAGQTLLGEYSEPAPGGMGTPNHFGVVGAQSATASKFDFVFFEGWYFDANSNPTFPKTVMLPSPAGSSYWQCYDCVVLKEACSSSAQSCAREYYARGGSLAISSATRNVNSGTFVATGTNLNFVEWDLSDPDTGGDIAVPNGRCATVATVFLDAGWEPAADAGSDAGTDAGTDAGVDAGIDAGIDDAGTDAGADGG